MKTMACFISLFATLLSCSESDDEFVTIASSENNISIESVDRQISYCVSDDGALYFRSAADYYALSDSLRQLSDEDFESWENKIGFTSYRTLFKEFLLTSMDMDLSASNSYVNSNSDFVYIDSYGLIQPIVEAQFLQNVINKDRCFYIAKNKYIVDSDYVTIEDLKSKSIIDKVKYTFMDKKVSTLAAGDEVTYPTLEYVHGNGSYKIFTWFRIYKTVSVSAFTGKFNDVILEVSVRPRKFVKISGYKDYNDMCYVEEMRIHMPGLGMGFVQDETGSVSYVNDQRSYLNTTSSSKKTPLFTSSYVIWSSQTQEFGRLQDPICVHYRARTGNTGKYGAAYNTYHPLSGMDTKDCGHRLVTEYQNVVY